MAKTTAKKTTAKKATVKKSKPQEVEFEKVVITEAMFAENPHFADQGLQIGDEIDVAVTVKTPEVVASEVVPEVKVAPVRMHLKKKVIKVEKKIINDNEYEEITTEDLSTYLVKI